MLMIFHLVRKEGSKLLCKKGKYNLKGKLLLACSGN